MEKHFYSISEVAELLNISQSNLRFWEKEFKQLQPRRNKGGIRMYTTDDISLIKQIKYLVEVRKLTLDGARLQLNQKKDEVTKHQEITERLRRVRSELKSILKNLSN
jgi:DNA-binding transcriptional MerR regulator